MDLASVVAALASVGVRVSGSNPNNNIQGDSSRACPTGLAGPEPSGTHIDPGQHFQGVSGQWLAGSLSPHSLPREAARPRTSCHTWVRGPIPPPQPSRTRRLGLHLRRRLCGGWGCGGGGLCRR